MKKKYINYSLSLTFLMCMFTFVSLTRMDHAGPQNHISQDKLTNNDYAQNEESDSYQKIIQKSKAENKKIILYEEGTHNLLIERNENDIYPKIILETISKWLCDIN